MANELDETDASLVNPEGLDAHVIQKKVGVTVTGQEKFVYVIGPWFLFVIPGAVLWGKRLRAKPYFDALQQKIQSAASTIDNYMENRVNILKNAAQLLDKAIDLDKDVMTKVAAYRGGANNAEGDAARNEMGAALEGISRQINVAFEAYPDLKAHQEIADVLQQNAYLQREITAARDLYNDAVNEWNQAIFELPAKKFTAAKYGYTTRIPFTTSQEIKQEARGTFFGGK